MMVSGNTAKNLTILQQLTVSRLHRSFGRFGPRICQIGQDGQGEYDIWTGPHRN